jgi:5-formyltetrahydrofolate cyclo-ligase
MRPRIRSHRLQRSEEKSRVRVRAREVRRAAAAAAPGAGIAIAARGKLLPDVAVVGLYAPMREEVDPAPLAHRLETRGAALALPVVVGDAMLFRRAGGPLVAGPFGTMHPASGEAVEPDLVLVPLLAFTRGGHRLGYGKGFYDRWIAAHSAAVTVGLAYAAQEVPALPLEPHDLPLDVILTEREAIVVNPARVLAA